MKYIIFSLLIIGLFSCKDKTENLLGTWTVNSNYYRAVCMIAEIDDTLKGQVLYYNDDTTIYRYEEGTVRNYFFNNIKTQKDGFIDAISGATKTGQQQAKLKLRHKDTLDVTTYIINKPLLETWTRIK